MLSLIRVGCAILSLVRRAGGLSYIDWNQCKIVLRFIIVLSASFMISVKIVIRSMSNRMLNNSIKREGVLAIKL